MNGSASLRDNLNSSLVRRDSILRNDSMNDDLTMPRIYSTNSSASDRNFEDRYASRTYGINRTDSNQSSV